MEYRPTKRAFGVRMGKTGPSFDAKRFAFSHAGRTLAKTWRRFVKMFANLRSMIQGVIARLMRLPRHQSCPCHERGCLDVCADDAVGQPHHTLNRPPPRASIVLVSMPSNAAPHSRAFYTSRYAPRTRCAVRSSRPQTPPGRPILRSNLHDSRKISFCWASLPTVIEMAGLKKKTRYALLDLAGGRSLEQNVWQIAANGNSSRLSTIMP